MMYKLFNWLFGWQYIAWRNTCDGGVARVNIDGNGKVWYWQYRNMGFAFEITDPDDVIWLTGAPPSILTEKRRKEPK